MTNSMKPLLLLPVVLFLASSCPLQQGADPVVVNAEKTERLAFDTVDSFLTFEKTNQVAIKQSAPQIHAYAETLRKNFPTWMATARSLTITYKNNRSSDNKASLQTALAVLTSAQVQATQYVTQLSNQKP